jgi:hypothetical protein
MQVICCNYEKDWVLLEMCVCVPELRSEPPSYVGVAPDWVRPMARQFVLQYWYVG